MRIEPFADFEHIWRVEGFDKEYQKLFAKSKQEYVTCLEELYRNLAMLDSGDVSDRKTFEKIENNLYAIRSNRRRVNPRVLYTAVLNDGRYILLLPFAEKSKTDYEEGKRRARAQIRALLGGKYHDT